MTTTNLLSLSSSEWDYPYWTSRQFLMYELSQLIRVIYCTERKDLREFPSMLLSAQNAAGPPFPTPENMHDRKAFWPKTYRFPRLDRIFASAHARLLQKRLDVPRNARRILYVWNPSFVDVVKSLSYDVLIYHPYDMFRHFSGATQSLVEREEEICELADALITPHRRVADALGHSNSHVINNGVFLPGFPPRKHLHPDSTISSLQRPIIGYIGAINDKLNFDVLGDVFSANSSWQLIILGFEGPGDWRECSGYLDLKKLPNVRFMGGVPINKVASVIAAFDVGIIPYSLSGWAKYSESPLKLYQYWAMGVPVVCSQLPNMRAELGALELCASSKEWQAGIARQLEARNDDLQNVLRSKAEKHSWSRIAGEVLDIIDSVGS